MDEQTETKSNRRVCLFSTNRKLASNFVLYLCSISTIGSAHSIPQNDKVFQLAYTVEGGLLLAVHSTLIAAETLFCSLQCTVAAFRTLLLPNCEGSHSVRLFTNIISNFFETKKPSTGKGIQQEFQQRLPS